MAHLALHLAQPAQAVKLDYLSKHMTMKHEDLSLLASWLTQRMSCTLRADHHRCDVTPIISFSYCMCYDCLIITVHIEMKSMRYSFFSFAPLFHPSLIT
jgi:hypothetical protein